MGSDPDKDENETLEPSELEADPANRAASGPLAIVRRAQTTRSELCKNLIPVSP